MLLGIFHDKSRYPEYFFSKLGIYTYAIMGIAILTVYAYNLNLALLNWRQPRKFIIPFIFYCLLLRFVYTASSGIF